MWYLLSCEDGRLESLRRRPLQLNGDDSMIWPKYHYSSSYDPSQTTEKRQNVRTTKVTPISNWNRNSADVYIAVRVHCVPSSAAHRLSTYTNNLPHILFRNHPSIPLYYIVYYVYRLYSYDRWHAPHIHAFSDYYSVVKGISFAGPTFPGRSVGTVAHHVPSFKQLMPKRCVP
jgi:hypothetical protein